MFWINLLFLITKLLLQWIKINFNYKLPFEDKEWLKKGEKLKFCIVVDKMEVYLMMTLQEKIYQRVLFTFYHIFQFIVANLGYSDEDDLSGACSKLHSIDNIEWTMTSQKTVAWIELIFLLHCKYL